MKKVYLAVGCEVTEADLMAAIANVCKRYARKFVFPPYTVEDIEQEIVVWVLKNINKFDPTKSNLDGFIHTHIKNRLINFKRDKQRKPCPCKKCQYREDGQTKHENGKHCKKYQDWLGACKTRSNINAPNSIEMFKDTEFGYTHTFFAQLEESEIFLKIDAELPIDMREDYLRFQEGVALSAVRKQALLDKLREILNATEI